MTGKADLAKFSSLLETHKTAIAVAVSVASLCLTVEIKADTTQILRETEALRQQMGLMLMQLTDLRQSKIADDVVMQRFVEEISSYAESVIEDHDLLPECAEDESTEVEAFRAPPALSLPSCASPQSQSRQADSAVAARQEPVRPVGTRPADNGKYHPGASWTLPSGRGGFSRDTTLPLTLAHLQLFDTRKHSAHDLDVKPSAHKAWPEELKYYWVIHEVGTDLIHPLTTVGLSAQ